MTPQNDSPADSPVQNIEYIRGFRFLFEDKNGWNNLLFGSILVLIPIIGPIVMMGWQMKIFQRLVERNPQPIPKFDFGDFVFYLTKGIIPFVVSLVIMIPFFFIIFAFAFIGGVSIPVLAAPGLAPELVAVSVVVGIFAIFCLGLLPMIVFSVAGLTRAYLTEDIGEGLAVGKLWAYGKATWKRVLLAYVVYFPLSIVLMFAGMLALYVGIYPAMVIMNIAWVFITWQIYELYRQAGGPEIPLKQPREEIPSLKPSPPPPPAGGAVSNP